MKRLSSFMVAVFFANAISPALLGGIPSDKAVYRGGTIAALAENTEGAVTTTDQQEFWCKNIVRTTLPSNQARKSGRS